MRESELAQMPEQLESARAERNRRVVEERCRYYVPNGRIEEFLQAIGRRFVPGSKRIWIASLRAGNGLGKSALGANLAAYLSDSYPNLYLDEVPYLKQFKRPNRGRILTTPNAAKNNYDDEFKKWLRLGRYKTLREGKFFNNRYRFEYGSEFDIFTFDQDQDQGESITLNWAIVDEPMDHKHWKALKSRFRFGGVIFLLYTDADSLRPCWYADEFETQERLADDVVAMEGTSEDACIEHGVRGLLPHSALMDMWRDMDDDDLLSRRDGLSRARAGSIYKTFRDDPTGNVLPDFPAYYSECWRRGLYTLWQSIDPHDRKPWAITWRAFFPNGKSFAVSEWPDMSMRPFHKIKSWHWGFEAYADLTVKTEAALGAGHAAHATVFDPNYGPSAAMTDKGVTSIAEEFLNAYRKLTGVTRRMLFPADAISPGHMKVKGVLGDPAKGVTPDYFWLEHCHNGRWGMTHYGYRENRDETKGQSQLPMLQYKDFPDTERYMVEAGARFIDPIEKDEPSVVLFKARARGKTGHRGA